MIWWLLTVASLIDAVLSIVWADLSPGHQKSQGSSGLRYHHGILQKITNT